jgi:branched-chain amino acid transport system ATP-binding protein
MLKVNNIEVCYMNVIQVLHGVSLEVADGQIVALLGANGSGKTSTLKAISGLLKTEEGEVTGGNQRRSPVWASAKLWKGAGCWNT